MKGSNVDHIGQKAPKRILVEQNKPEPRSAAAGPASGR
jgi:hypothetical protein